MRRLPALALPLLLAASVAAQTGTLAGRVVGTDGVPLPGATVLVEATARGAATDLDGRFEVGGLAPGAYRVTASTVGYAPATERVEVAAGERAEVQFVLVEAALDPGEVVVTARETLTGRGTLDLPGSGHYVGAKTLQTVGDYDVHRVLREVPGVTVQEEDGYGLRPNVGLRGSGAERSGTITLMEDGVLIAPAPYAAPAAYYFPTTGRMDGVEVRTGAGQIKYGPATTGGALNLVAAQIPDGFEARGEARLGANDQRTLHARVGDATASAGWLGGAGVGFVAEVRSDNVDGFKTIEGPGGAALLGPEGDELSTGFEKLDLFGRLRVATAPGAAVYQSLTLTAGLTDEVSDETYLGLTDDDFAATPFARYAGSQRDQMDADHRALRARHVAVFSDHADLTTTVYRNAFARNWYKLDKAAGAEGGAVGIAALLDDPGEYADAYAALRGAAPGRLFVKANNREYLSRGVQTVAGLRTGGALVEAGLRLHADEMDRFQWVDEYATADAQTALAVAGTPGTDSNRIESARAVAGFVQAEVPLGRVVLTPGVRVESVRLRREDFGKGDPDRTGADLAVRENTATAFIPGLGAVADLGAGWRAFGGVHRGFAPPDSRPETDPEASVNTEVGVRYGSRDVEVQVAGYWTAYENLLGSDLAAAGGGGTSDQFNGGRVDVFGAEVGVTADLVGLAAPPAARAGWAAPLRVAYTLTDGRFRNAFESDFDAWGTVAEGDALPYQARHRLYVRAGVERAGWSTAVLANAVSDMRTAAGQGAIPASERIDAHVTFDLVAEAPLPGGVALTARAINLTDATYAVARRPAGLRPGLPRTLAIGLRARIGR
ncbi:TonB-dependent receptor [Rubrivirga sp. S365]|uniref:TonB-dependent receptor domain-containing protein n=1 Tax=Rubrivirga sp. S365 TaxID=3076080 RepID=UPI0028C531BB|nr:TonB-dependent receptor [Rubrivirga sp. S365]MDT7856212.1 TonB-dependent receptor [Rubrivirga sp. S365]